MFTYELHQERQNYLRHRADEWRLARDARAARTAERRARRAGPRTTERRPAGPSEPVPTSHGRVHRALHPHSAR